MNSNEDIITRPYSPRNMDWAHAEAITEDAARAAQVVTTTASGLVITRGMLDEEIRSTRRPRRPVAGQVPFIQGINASSNMFA